MKAAVFCIVSFLFASHVLGGAPPPAKFNTLSDPAGLDTWRRSWSPMAEAETAFRIANSPMLFDPGFVDIPTHIRSMVGAAVFDYDGDGCEDIYLPTGPGRANSLFRNKFCDTGGAVTFEDVAVAAGVGSESCDAQGACVGDIDNDGHLDLYVTCLFGVNVLYRNNGDGTFTDITGPSGAGGGFGFWTHCAFIDSEPDGHVDIWVANTYNRSTGRALWLEAFDLSRPNILLRNNGDLTFTDVSAASGVLDMRLVPTGKATITWATVTADMNGDGCTDILQSDDQALLGLTRQGGTDRGLIHMFMNRCDGTGKYDDVLAVNSSGVVQADHYALSNWMGFALGNWNCDKRLDMFSTGAGNYVHPVFLGVAFTMEETASKWFMNRGMQPGGSGIMDMQTPGLGPEVVANGFGWGATSGDYDNDGFQDIIYSGGLDAQGILFAPTDRVYMNKRTCDDFPFSVHHDILDNVPNANLRETMASLTADFNNDGFADYLSTSPVNWDPRIGLERYDQPFPGTTLPNIFGVEEDGLARWKFRMDSNGTHFSHILAQDAFQLNGTAVVQMNDARSGNNWLTVRLMGSVGLACGGRVNRAAIGATIHSWPGKPECADSPRGIYAIAGGSSINSQESLVKQIGLGSSSVGTIAIQWPGGHWNVYAGLMAKRRYDILELPCDVCTMSRKEHRLCVADAIAALRTGSTPAGTNLNDLRVAAVCGFLLKEIVCDAD